MPQTGRERIMATLRGGKPDRLAVDLGATELTGISAGVYGPLKKHLGVAGGHTRIADPFRGTVRLERSSRAKLMVDALGLAPEPLRWRAGRLPCGTDCLLPERWQTSFAPDGAEVFRHDVSESVFRRAPGERTFRLASPPLAESRSTRDVARHLQSIAFFDWPHHADEIAPQFGVRAAARRAETDGACVLNLRARLLGGAVELRGENLARDLEELPTLAKALLGRLADTYVARLTDILPEVAPYADVVAFVEGPAGDVSVENYRRFFRPHQARVFDHVRKTASLPICVFLQGVGADLAAEIVAAGADAVGVGCAPGSATAAELRSRLGPEVPLWGVGCPAGILETGTPEEVRAEILRAIEDAGGSERLVFAFGEPVPEGARPENIIAALDAARGLRA